ncbi:MAG: DMT family transporter [Thermoleophilia bacterium]|nr:DMT family transporter [Thermoleophilia bacterium]
MPPLAFTLAIGAAVLHAFWNVLLARSRDPESATAVALVAAVVVFAPVAAMRFEAEFAVWPYIVATSMLQLLYFALLATAYRKAELSFVYPIARGVAPVIVLVVSVVVLGHDASPTQAVGVVLVGLGVQLVRGPRRPTDPHALAFALGIASIIASYTLLDKRGITHASPITYLELSMIPAALGYAVATLAVKGRARVQAEFGVSAVVAGILSFAAYTLVLAALERASAASVAAVRETSVVMATAFAAVVLLEGVTRLRLAGAVLVVCGIALLVLR